jgi:hypothetical protein
MATHNDCDLSLNKVEMVLVLIMEITLKFGAVLWKYKMCQQQDGITA